MVLPDSHGDRSTLRFGTVRFQRTRLAIFDGELDFDDLVIIAIHSRSPTQTFLSCGASRFFRLPIDLEEAFVKALLLFALPLMVSSRGRK